MLNRPILLIYKTVISFALNNITIDNVDKESMLLLFKIAREGKLLSTFCKYMEYFLEYLPEDYKSYLRYRCTLTRFYNTYLETVGEELNSKDIEYYIFKTIKPFAYDMTDIDILFIRRKGMLLASKLLINKHGFKPIARGTHSIALRKTINGFDIDLDLQTKISAGTFEYLPILNIKNHLGEIGYIKNNLKVLRPELELSIIAGHAFYKDFTISLASILHAWYLFDTVNKSILSTILSFHQHMVKPLKYLAFLGTLIFNLINSETKQYYFPNDTEQTLLLKGVYKALSNQRGYINIPLTIIVVNYIKTIETLVKAHQNDQLKQLLIFPRSRGIAQLFIRLGLLSS